MNTDSPLRHEARLKVTGRATYAAEAPFPDLLHAALVESNVSRGRVLEVDAAGAHRSSRRRGCRFRIERRSG